MESLRSDSAHQAVVRNLCRAAQMWLTVEGTSLGLTSITVQRHKTGNTLLGFLKGFCGGLRPLKETTVCFFINAIRQATA